mgnify:FL=1
MRMIDQILTQGSSPRMRGTRDAVDGLFHSEGIIPAYAGNTTRIPLGSPA